ncbi:peptidoglycan-binding protein [Candidatus Parcubacteria bacterium]|nr:peptidoglycan-binding protein [Candidatus Parcubacteria bacterium]
MNNTSTKKIVAGLLSFAMVLTLVAGVAVSSASAQTSVYTRNLTVGSRGADVTALQAMLQAGNFLSVSPTGYFGSLTRAALAAWQASVGISPAAGYFGPITRARVSGGVVTPGPGTPGCPAGAVYNYLTGQMCSGGNQGPVGLDNTDGSITASLSTYASDVTIKKGEEKDMVAVKLQATAGNVSVNRFDVRFAKRPWLYFNKITLKDSTGAVIAVRNLSSAADATEITVGSDYLVRFEGLSNVVVRPGSDRTFVVAGMVHASTDKITNGETMVVSVPNASIRTINGRGYTDSLGLGAVATAGTSGRTVTFDTNGSVGNIVVRANPTQTARVQNTSTSGQTAGVELGKFDFKSENQNATISTLIFTLKDNGGNVAWSNALKNFRLTDGSSTYNVTSVATSSTFSNLNIQLTKDQYKTLTLVADIADQDEFTNGMKASTTITVNNTNISGVDANYNTLTATGANVAASPDITFLSTGASISNISAAVPQPIDNGSSAVVKHSVSMSFTFNNTGNNDLYISKTPATALATSTTATSGSLDLVSVGTPNGGDTTTYWVISPGVPRTFTYTGVINNTSGTAGSKEFKITKIFFDDDTTGLQEANIDFGIEGLRVTASY